jgi:hypothetical protein
MIVHLDGKELQFQPGDSICFQDTGNHILFFPKSGVEQAKELLLKVMEDEQARNQREEGARSHNTG